MTTIRTWWTRHPGTRLILLGLILLLGGNRSTPGCAGGSCGQIGGVIGEIAAVVIVQIFGVDMAQYLQSIDIINPSVCGDSLPATGNTLQMSFTAPIDPASFSVERNITYTGNISFGSPSFQSGNTVIVVPFTVLSFFLTGQYTITLTSDISPIMVVQPTSQTILKGQIQVTFYVRNYDGVSPFIQSMSPGLSRPRTYSEYVALTGTPIDAQLTSPHTPLVVDFSEPMGIVSVVPQRGSPLPGTGLGLLPQANPSEIFLRRQTVSGHTQFYNDSHLPFWPGVSYSLDFSSCLSSCATNCLLGSVDVSGMWLSPYNRTTATDSTCLYNSACEIALSKNDDIRAFTTAKVRIDTPAFPTAFPQGTVWYSTGGPSATGIMTPDMGSVTLTLVDSSGTVAGPLSTTLSAPGQYGYVPWSGSIPVASWQLVPEGTYWLQATATDGSDDRILVGKDLTPPVVAISGITPSCVPPVCPQNYTRGQFTVSVTATDSLSGVGSVWVVVTDGVNTPVTAQAAFQGGTYSASVNLVTPGWPNLDPITIQAFASDNAGNQAQSVTQSYIIVTVPPVIDQTSITIGPNCYNSTAGRTEYSQNPTVSGMVSIPTNDPTGLLGVVINGAQAAATAGGPRGVYSFSASLTGLAPGNNSIRIQAYDQVWNYMDLSVPIYVAPSPEIFHECIIPGMHSFDGSWAFKFNTYSNSCATISGISALFDGAAMNSSICPTFSIYDYLCSTGLSDERAMYPSLGLETSGIHCASGSALGHHVITAQVTDSLGDVGSQNFDVYNLPTSVKWSAYINTSLVNPTSIEQIFRFEQVLYPNDPFWKDPNTYLHDLLGEYLKQNQTAIPSGSYSQVYLKWYPNGNYSLDAFNIFNNDFNIHYIPAPTIPSLGKIGVDLVNAKNAWAEGTLEVWARIPYPEFYSCLHCEDPCSWWGGSCEVCTNVPCLTTGYIDSLVWSDAAIRIDVNNFKFSLSLVPQIITSNGKFHVGIRDLGHQADASIRNWTVPALCNVIAPLVNTALSGYVNPLWDLAACAALVEFFLNKYAWDIAEPSMVRSLEDALTRVMKQELSRGLPCMLKESYGPAFRCCGTAASGSINNIDQIPLVAAKFENSSSLISTLDTACQIFASGDTLPCPPGNGTAGSFLNLYYVPCEYQ